MSDAVDTAWAALAAGTGGAPEDPRVMGELRQRFLGALESGDVAARHEAVAVADALAEHGGLHWLARLAEDADPGVRRAALGAGAARGEPGLAVVRAFAGDPDEELALDAIGLLAEAGDRAATPRVRGLLSSPLAAVRAAAAHLLGQIAGPVVAPQLGALADGDPDERVRRSAALALQRVVGAIPRGGPSRWHPDGDEPAPAPAPAPVPGAAPAPAPVERSAVAPPPRPAPAPSAVRPLGPRPTSPPPAARELVALPMAPDGELPDPLPTDPRGLLLTLGLCRAVDRAAVLDRLRAADAAALSAAIAAYASGTEPAWGVGAARAAAALGLSSSASDLRRWVHDPSAPVRAAAVDALGRLGGPAVLPALAALLRDGDAAVRLAAVEALSAAALRHDARAMARTWLTPAAHGPDRAVADAARAALERLR